LNHELLKILDQAIYVATKNHYRQFDKAGLPYILHPMRVMMSIDTIPEKIVVILHDVLEDTDLTSDNLIELRIPEWLVSVVKILTKVPGQNYSEYLNNIMTSETAIKVKIADMRDNADLLRYHDLEEKHLKMIKKYHKGIKFLTRDLEVRTRL
jgi:guanosine-3',5'-bis(diphosphate) 3'-pyrophosphohydrolase